MGETRRVRISEEKFEELRKTAFNKRTTMKDILEKALADYIVEE